jgi:PhzF family phenazine biosynthesis protein
MTFPLYIVDAFASRAFEGNPAAVCLLRQPAEPDWMQQVAAEMNLSETAFVVPRQSGFGLRWFTPTVEVDLCGHATLAAAHALWQHGAASPRSSIDFQTQSGRLTCTHEDGWIEMDFPAEAPVDCEAPGGLEAALGTTPIAVGRNRLDLVVELASEGVVREAQPIIEQLVEYPVRGTILTARSDDARYDFVSRFFAPACGVNEDPVCGSAHCCLGPYWGARLGKTELIGHQVSRRGGIVRVKVCGARVKLAGRAVTVMAGQLLDP